MQHCNYTSFLRNIDGAWQKLKHHPEKYTVGVDELSIADFISNEKKLLGDLKDRLKSGSFCFSPLRPVRINDGKREILIAIVDDRIVERALLKTIIPRLRLYVTKENYCPVEKAPKSEDAIIGVRRAAEEMKTAFSRGQADVFETDIIDFFGSINRRRLLSIIKTRISDPRVLTLIEGNIAFEKWKCAPEDYGLAQGSVLSPLFATIYLDEFDRKIGALQGVKLIRYVDDLVILCSNPMQAKEMYALVEREMDKIDLKIHPLGKEVKGRIKTNIVNVGDEPLTFLGLTFNLNRVTISKGKIQETCEDIKYILSVPKLTFLAKIVKIRNKLKGFIEQYKHYDTRDQLNALVRLTQGAIDNHYHQAHLFILGQPPYLGVSEHRKKKFKKFFGLDVTDLAK